MKIFIIAMLFCCPLLAGGQEITFKDHGKLVKRISLENLAALAKIEKITVWDPNEEDEIGFEAYPVESIFENIYGAGWKKSEEVLFTCLDGYQPSVPVVRFQKYRGLFAVKRTGSDNAPLIIKSEGNKKINFAPLYLIWDNAKNSEIRTGDGPAWPYQVTSVDLEDFSKMFPRLAPPSNSSNSAKRGFLAFRKNCLGCHTLNGDGGTGGPELNYPVNITEYYDHTWLKKWISDPTSIRFRTGMPGLNKNIPNHDGVLSDIMAYLKAMAKNKIKPKS